MKLPIHFVRTHFFTIFALLAAAGMAYGDDAGSAQQNQAYQKAVQQENLQKDMVSIQQDLASMREEMKQLLPADVGLVDKAFKQIDSLSANEIRATIDSLRAAGRTGDVKGRLEQLASAYGNQTQAVVKIKGISGELSARGIREDVAEKLSELLKREVADMDEVGRLAQVGQNPDDLQGNYHQRYTVVLGDQVALTDDVKTTIQTITDAATNLPADVRGPLLAAAGIVKDHQLASNADQAVLLVHTGPFTPAVAAQGTVVDTLAMVIHSLSSDEKVLQQLHELSDALAQIMDDQKGLEGVMGRQRGGNLGYDMQRRQMDVSDHTGEVRAMLTPLNGQAASLVQKGQGSMEQVVTILAAPGRQVREQVPPAQDAAIADLAAAKKAIDDEIALLNANQAPTLEQLIADLESLLEEVKKAAADEAKTAQAAQTPDSPDMPTAQVLKAFHDHVDTLQQKALPISPDAAQAIGEASQQLTVASAASQQQAVVAAHVGAAADLQKAVAILEKELAQLEADSKAQADLQAAIEKVEDALKDTDAAKTDLNSNKDKDANSQLGNAEQDVTDAMKAVGDAQQTAGLDSTEATADLQDASTATTAAMNATTPVAMTNATNAQTAETKALAALQKEMAALNANEAAAEAGNPETGAGEEEEAGTGDEAGAGAGAGASGIGDAQGPMIEGQTGTTGQGIENTNLEGNAKGMAGGDPGGLGDYAGAGGWNGPVQIVSGLSPHDRAAVTEMQSEKPPREFVPQVQQYYRNLADGTGL